MSNSKILLALLVAFIGGVFGRSFFSLGQNWYLLGLVFGTLLLLVFYRNKYAALAAFMLFSFVFGAWRTDSFLQEVLQVALDGKTLKGKAAVIKVADSTFGQNLIIEMESAGEKKAPGRVALLLRVPPYPAFAYGDLLEISCVAKAIENLSAGEAGGGADFDYRMYMAKEGVLYSCENKRFEKIGESRGNLFLSAVQRLRISFKENIDKVIPSPEGALAGGLLFGGSGGLSQAIRNDFSRTGMTHIVAVSGYNVTIIAEYLILLGIFLGLWRAQAIWFALAGIILFVIMIGFPASAVRAGIMGGVLLWAMKNGRLASAENAIVLAAAIMLIVNPLALRWDVGFQLSFLATLGIVLSSPFWEKSFIKRHRALGISEIIALSLSAQIFVLPIIAYNFHSTSLISLLANVFILPIVPVSMLLVFITAVSGFVFGFVSLVFAWLAYLPLHYELELIHVLAQFSWASVRTEKVSAWFVFGYYVILVVAAGFFRRRLNNFEIPAKTQRENSLKLEK